MLRRNEVSSHLPSNFLCSSRGKKIWTAEEDNCLKELVESLGTGNWTLIAQSLPTRTGKQCRERWHNHLGAGIKKGEWTEEEDRIIINMQRTIGNQWAKITKMLPGRTDNAVKNRFHATERARSRGGRFGDDNASYQSQLPMYNPSSGQYKVEKGSTGTGFHHNYDSENVDCSESENDYEVDEDEEGGDDCMQGSERDSATDLMELDIISFDEEDFAFDNDGTMTFDPSANKAAANAEKSEIDPCCFNFDWCNRMTGGIKQEPVMPPQPPQYYPIGGYGQQQQQQQHQHHQQQQQQYHHHQQQQQQQHYGAYPSAPNGGMNLQNRFSGGQSMPARTWM